MENKTIYCDGEYRAMMNKVSDDLDVVMNYTLKPYCGCCVCTAGCYLLQESIGKLS